MPHLPGHIIANGGNITLADGRKLYVGSSGTSAPYDERRRRSIAAGDFRRSR